MLLSTYSSSRLANASRPSGVVVSTPWGSLNQPLGFFPWRSFGLAYASGHPKNAPIGRRSVQIDSRLLYRPHASYPSAQISICRGERFLEGGFERPVGRRSLRLGQFGTLGG